MKFKKGERRLSRVEQVRVKFGADPAAYTPEVLKELANGDIINPNRYYRPDLDKD